MNTYLQNISGGCFYILQGLYDISYENSDTHTRRLYVAAA